MKNAVTIVSCIAALTLTFWIAGCSKNSFAAYKISSSANEPTLPLKTKIIISKMIKPKLFDFIVFHAEMQSLGKYVAVFRLCGIEGDVVEIREGNLYVNQQMVDSRFDLNQRYTLSSDEFVKIVDSVDINATQQFNDSVHLSLTTAFVKRHQLKAKRFLLNKTEADESIRAKFSQNWNQDHFGPVAVPPGHYFVLGDNRYGAADSRYQGFIPKEKFVATVLSKH